MSETALQIYESLNSYSRIKNLIDNGEAEGLYIECKAPHEPNLNRSLKEKLAIAASGFANTEGGIIIWGMSTTKHPHSGLDIMTQIVPIGNPNRFAQQVERSIIMLTTPSITKSRTKTIVKPKEKRGVVLTYIPKTLGDPIQIIKGQKFYFRNGDEFSDLPYEMLKRLFAATESPDLYPIFDEKLITNEENGLWKIPIIISNESSAIAEHTTVFVTIQNPSSCETINFDRFRDVSDINPGQKKFVSEPVDVIHRGINFYSGYFKIGMLSRKRNLRFKIDIYANKMRARSWHISCQLTKKGFILNDKNDYYIY
jgi:hypothetical protein